MTTTHFTTRIARRPIVVLLTVLPLTFGLAHAAPAHGQTEADPEPPPHAVHDRAESDAIDVALIARQKGWTIEQTTRHMADQERFGDLQDAIEAQDATVFSGAEFATKPGGRSFLRFKGTVPTAAKTLATASGLNVRLTGNRKYSATELGNRATAIATFFQGHGYEQVAVAVLPTGRTEVAISGQRRPGVALPLSLRGGTRVRYTDQDVSLDHHTFGGAEVSSSSSECTSGFSVEHETTGETGATTAAHCDGLDTYLQPLTNISYDFDFEDAHLGLFGDVEWHSTPNHSDLAEYFANVTDQREVNSVETSSAVNNTYCVFSRQQSTRICDDVWSTIVVQVSGSGIASDLIGMDDRNTVAGDSGGPWSFSTEAAGGVKGAIYLPFGWHDTWSKAWKFDNAIDVDVLTQP